MRLRMRWFSLLLAVAAASCSTDRILTHVRPATPRADIEDGAHGGNPHFYFLPPMVAAPAPTGTFDATVSPAVAICAWSGSACTTTVAQFTMTTGPGSETVRLDAADELYLVNWHTDQFALSTTATYRIRVLVGNQELGHADVSVVSNGSQLKNVATGEYIGLVDGKTLPIKFRVEQGALVVPPAITAASIITTVAGTGLDGFTGFGGPAIAANIGLVNAVRAAPGGAFYISVASGQYYPAGHVLRVGPDGIIQNVAGDGQASVGSSAGCHGDNGPAIDATVNANLIQAIAPDGTFYFYDGGDCAYERKVTPDGIIHPVPGVGDPPTGVIAPDGSLYFTYSGGAPLTRTIQRLNLDGTLTPFAGTGASGISGDGGPALQATFSDLWAITRGPDGSIYVSDGSCLIRRIDASGIITHFAGTGVCGYSGDGGPATTAQFHGITDLAVGPDGALYVADTQNNVVRRVGTDGTITTVAGTGAAGSGGDGGPAGMAQLNWPFAVSFASDGALLVGEFFGRRVRRIK